MGITAFPNGLSSNGVPIFGNGSQDISGNTYFVENNSGSDSNDGKSWEKPFKTLARAVTISNLDITGTFAARRNTIYYVADTETAALVVFPNKCDVIGVGSYDANTKPGITGHHVPVNSGNYGTRFINVWFKATAVASPIVTLASTSGGCQFINCTFDGVVGTVTSGILATASTNLRVVDCTFMGGFATSYISFGAGQTLRPEILRNKMNGAVAAGIVVASDTTAAYGGWIVGNCIQAGTITIDDNSDLFYVMDNELISAGVGATVGTMADAMQCDINVFRASGNRLACSNVCGIVVPPVDSTT